MLDKEIINEFQRLEVSTDDHPCSGLMASVPNMEYPIADIIVDIRDDYSSGSYDARKVLAYLKEMQPSDCSLASEDANNIWQHLAEFEV
jgi:hypothetical protein